MFRILRKFRDLHVSITCAEIPGLLSLLNEQGVVLHALDYTDVLTITAIIEYRYYKMLMKTAHKYGAEVKILDRSGVLWSLYSVKNRYIFLTCCLVVLFLTFWVPERIFVIKVEGNTKIPDNMILEKAACYGICFGASARNIRSENLKNALLEEIPDLQWIGINVYGCRAVISVRERIAEEATIPNNSVSSIVAVCDGMIQSLTVTKGSVQCKIGDHVSAGDVLISGYTDCGLFLRATHAEGEIFAVTERFLEVYFPLVYHYRTDELYVETNISLIIGKKRINFFKDSGILGTSCVKMYNEYSLSLPGNFTMPVTLVVERYCIYECEAKTVDSSDCRKTADVYCKQYLLGQMLSGSFVENAVETQQTDELLIYCGKFICHEMIGRVRYEGEANYHVKTD